MLAPSITRAVGGAVHACHAPDTGWSAPTVAGFHPMRPDALPGGDAVRMTSPAGITDGAATPRSPGCESASASAS